MVTATKKRTIAQQEHEESGVREGGILSITATALDVIGKVGLAIGITGVLIYLFSFAEAMLGIGVVYTGIGIISAGIASTVLANKLNTGFWLQGAFA